MADEISDLMAEARAVDADEDARYGPGKRGGELQVELANRQSRAAAMHVVTTPKREVPGPTSLEFFIP